MKTESEYGTLYGVGVGPGNPDLLTLRAADVLRKVDVIFHVSGPRTRESISKTVVETVDGCAGKSDELRFSMSNDPAVRRNSVAAAAEKVIAVLKDGRDCAFATIGDPLIYSTFSYLLRHVREQLPQVHVEVVPGITAFQAAAAEWATPLVEDEEILTVLPRWDDNAKRQQALAGADTVVCLKTYRERQLVLKTLQEQMSPEDLLYAARVGHADETVETKPEAIADYPIDYLSLIIARRRSTHD